MQEETLLRSMVFRPSQEDFGLFEHFASTNKLGGRRPRSWGKRISSSIHTTSWKILYKVIANYTYFYV